MDFNGIIEEFGIDKMPEDKQSMIMNRLIGTVNTRVGLRMAEKLGPEEAKRIDELTAKDAEKGFKEIEKIYPEFQKVYQEEIDKLREEMRAMMPSKEELDKQAEEIRKSMHQ